MRILFLTFYFEPDLCAGSFRNTALLKELIKLKSDDISIDVVTTMPNRYGSFEAKAHNHEKYPNNTVVNRIELPEHNSGIKGQIIAFRKFYYETLKLTRGKKYDLVYASSSRLFTAYLGSKIAKKNSAKLYLDIRDIFRESIVEIFKSQILKTSLNLILKPIESRTFKDATHINLVSKGFKSYFIKYDKPSYSYFTNGVDSIFLDLKPSVLKGTTLKEIKTILYAGNIGEGQGLHNIIPEASSKLKDFEFKIIGDGGARKKLEEAIKNKGVSNVKIHDPIERDALILEYQNADFLFLHLNTYNAFKRVLPSKIFEYAVFNKPIIAGVGGYAKSFVNSELNNVIWFPPAKANSFIKKLEEYEYPVVDNDAFVKKYSRISINKNMVESILKLLNDVSINFRS